VRRQWLFAAGIGGANGFTEPVIIPFVNAVNQDKTWFGKVVGRTHYLVPQLPCRYSFIHFTRDLTGSVAQIAFRSMIEQAPYHLHVIIELNVGAFILPSNYWSGYQSTGALLHCLNKTNSAH